jgi:hypothetical protein
VVVMICRYLKLHHSIQVVLNNLVASDQKIERPIHTGFVHFSTNFVQMFEQLRSRKQVMRLQ